MIYFELFLTSFWKCSMYLQDTSSQTSHFQTLCSHISMLDRFAALKWKSGPTHKWLPLKDMSVRRVLFLQSYRSYRKRTGLATLHQFSSNVTNQMPFLLSWEVGEWKMKRMGPIEQSSCFMDQGRYSTKGENSSPKHTHMDVKLTINCKT
jgi:hypothetical protein